MPTANTDTLRERMVQQQIKARGIQKQSILHALRLVPRDQFVSPAQRAYAYEDMPLPIPDGQTISQPYVVALMIEALQVGPDARVLEIGTGSGYAAAVLSRIVAEVDTVERIGKLAVAARQRLAQLGYENVRVHHADGTLGWPDQAPYDGILVSAGGPAVPHALLNQLALNGRLVIPVGKNQRSQRLLCVHRADAETFVETDLGGVQFVPLIGQEGWGRDEG